nr:NAD dependent deacetylase sirtuin 6 [Hymenolepis microstoma]
MSQDYASSLSAYHDKGILGLPEIHDPASLFEQKVEVLTDLLRNSKHTVVHTGAGLSTSAGIPDFRGPNGVWSLEKQGKKLSNTKPFVEARPTIGHMALVALERAGYIHYVVTQNIDGLHLRSGFPRNRLSILHGDAFMEYCASCGVTYIRSTTAVPTFGQKETGAKCTKLKTRIRSCGGKLKDSVLDWEDTLIEPDFTNAINESKNATLHLCLGLSPNFLPSALLPFSAESMSTRRSLLSHFTKLEDNTIDLDATTSADISTIKSSSLDNFDRLITAPFQLTDQEVDEFFLMYMASDARLANGAEALSNLYLSPPQGMTKHFKWTRKVNSFSSPSLTKAKSGRRGLRRKAQLHVCLGTSLQIFPAAELPFPKPKRSYSAPVTVEPKRKRRRQDIGEKATNGTSSESLATTAPSHQQQPKQRVVIVNLQTTNFDSKAEFCMHTEIDCVLTRVCKNLGVNIPKIDEVNSSGPFIPKIVFRSAHTKESEPFPWTILSHPENTVSPFFDDGDNEGESATKVEKSENRKEGEPDDNSSRKEESKDGSQSVKKEKSDGKIE